jgi:hypothetical protein
LKKKWLTSKSRRARHEGLPEDQGQEEIFSGRLLWPRFTCFEKEVFFQAQEV